MLNLGSHFRELLVRAYSNHSRNAKAIPGTATTAKIGMFRTENSARCAQLSSNITWISLPERKCQNAAAMASTRSVSKYAAENE